MSSPLLHVSHGPRRLRQAFAALAGCAGMGFSAGVPAQQTPRPNPPQDTQTLQTQSTPIIIRGAQQPASVQVVQVRPGSMSRDAFGMAQSFRSRFPGTFGPPPDYTSPISPFATYPPNASQRPPFNNQVHTYTSPISPFATYRPGRVHPYRYRNGLYGYGSFQYGWGNACYPFYYPDYIAGVTYLSPYAFYSDVFPPFIASNGLYQAPPQVIYVPVPMYQEDGRYRGWKREDIDDYYLNRDARDEENRPKSEKKKEKEPEGGSAEQENGDRAPDNREEPKESEAAKPKRSATARAIDLAVDDVKNAWRQRDIQLIAKYTAPKSKIAVYLRGKYQYSLEVRDYLEMTRDAFEATRTLRFDLDAPQRKERGVYTLTGRHLYRNKIGEERTVYVSYVLELKDGKYIITQVGTAPDRIEE